VVLWAGPKCGHWNVRRGRNAVVDALTVRRNYWPMRSQSSAEIFAPSSELRELFCERYGWVTHETGLCFLGEIRRTGLMPRQPCLPPAEFAGIGLNDLGIVCLKPWDSRAATGSSHAGETLTLAVKSSDLPRMLALDWSYSPQIVLNRWKTSDLPKAVFSLKIIGEFGSVVALETLPASVLRVRTKGSASDPATWPPLIEAQIDQVHIEPAKLG
jgi:hypothetical protein